MNFRVILFFMTMILLAGGPRALAFPELIRYGYFNCSACHATNRGGDLLTPYGRVLSLDLLSRNDSIFKNPSSEKKLLEIESPEWLQIGLQARFLQAFSESSVASKGRFLVMQTEAQALAKISEEFWLYSSVGRFEAAKENAEWRDFIYLPEVWFRAQKAHGEGELWTLKVGRFFPVYGIWTPEHTFVNRSALGLNPGEERLAAEFSYTDENYQVYLTSIQARGQNGATLPEKGFILQLSKVFGQRSRAGVNAYRSRMDSAPGTSVENSFEGIFGLFGWNEKLSILIQVDQKHNPEGKTGFLDFVKVSYALTQGVEVFATQEYLNANLEKSDPRSEAYGVGARYHPVPNVDLTSSFRLNRDSSQLNEFQKSLWLIAHIFL